MKLQLNNYTLSYTQFEGKIPIESESQFLYIYYMSGYVKGGCFI